MPTALDAAGDGVLERPPTKGTCEQAARPATDTTATLSAPRRIQSPRTNGIAIPSPKYFPSARSSRHGAAPRRALYINATPDAKQESRDLIATARAELVGAGA